MKIVIQADAKGKNAIEQLCDVALRVGGMSNRKQVNLVADSIVLLPEPEKESEVEDNA